MNILLTKANSNNMKMLLDTLEETRNGLLKNNNIALEIRKNLGDQIRCLKKEFSMKTENIFGKYLIFFKGDINYNEVRDIEIYPEEIDIIKDKLKENPNYYYDDKHIYVLIINNLIEEVIKKKNDISIDNLNIIRVLTEFLYAMNNANINVINREQYKCLLNELRNENKSRKIPKEYRKQVTSIFSKKEVENIEETELSETSCKYTEEQMKRNFEIYGNFIDKVPRRIDLISNRNIGYSIEEKKDHVILNIHMFHLTRINTGGEILETMLRENIDSKVHDLKELSFGTFKENGIYPALTYKIYISSAQTYIIGVENEPVTINGIRDIRKYYLLEKEICNYNNIKSNREIDEFFKDVLLLDLKSFLKSNQLPLGEVCYKKLEKDILNPYSYYNFLNQKHISLYYDDINNLNNDKDYKKYILNKLYIEKKALGNG